MLYLFPMAGYADPVEEPSSPSQAVTRPLRRILCPVDFSEASLAALRAALEIAEVVAAERVDALHVFQFPYAGSGELLVDIAGQGARQRLDQLARAEVDGRIEQAAGQVSVPRRVALDWRVASGEPAQKIIDWAAGHGCDLIVMAARGGGGLREWLTGTVTERVVRGAACGVLTVRPQVAEVQGRKN